MGFSPHSSVPSHSESLRFLIPPPDGGFIRNDSSFLIREGKDRRFAKANRLSFLHYPKHPCHSELKPRAERRGQRGILFTHSALLQSNPAGLTRPPAMLPHSLPPEGGFITTPYRTTYL